MKINKLASLLLAMATVAGITSCGSGSSDSYWKNIDAIAVQESSDGNWSFYKPDGTLLYEDEFKARPSAICNGFFVVEEGDGYTVYHADKKPEVLGDLEDLKSAGYFWEDGLMPVVRPKERISVVNTKGETVFTLEPYKGKEIVSCDPAFSEGLLGVETEDGLYGFVNTKGEMVIVPKYKWANTFNYGRAAVSKNDEDETSLIIDKKGEPLFNLRKGQIVENPYLTAEYILVQDTNDHLLILDTKGETVFKCPSKVKRVVDVRGNKLIFKNDDGECGLMNLDGETLIRPKYSGMQFMDGDKLLAQLDDYAVVINIEGEESLRLEDYKEVWWSSKFGFVARDRNDYVFLDKEGKSVKNADFSQIYTAPINLYCHPISSDYFNMDAVVNAVVGLVKDNGVGKYHFGDSPAQVFSDGYPRQYSGDYSARINDLDITGVKYSISVSGHFTSAIAQYNYSYYSSSSYTWGTGKLLGFTINISTQSDWGKEGSEALLKAFERNGYKLVKRTGKKADRFAALLQQGNKLILIGAQKDGSDGEVAYVDDADGYKEIFENLVQQADTADEVPYDVEVVEEVPAVEDSTYYY
ncbi:MAG: WG repeat-containing protein [Muribaculaceae bacterium]|nr:WG repeat-containing protein [Muribaculaceae bacterium]